MACALARAGIKLRSNQQGKVASPRCYSIKGGVKPPVACDRGLKANRSQKAQSTMPLFEHLNKERNRKRNKEQFNERYRNDEAFRLYHILKRRHRKIMNIWIGRMENETSSIASKRHVELLGTSVDNAKRWIESMFTDGMAWNKIGVGEGMLSIDHVVPCSWFDHSNDYHARLCWNYQNLRPMWFLDNIKRGDSGDGIIDHFQNVRWSLTVQALLDFAVSR